MSKTLLLNREFTVDSFSRLLDLISQYNLIYKDSDLRLSLSNEYIDDTTLYLSIFNLQNKIKEIIGNIEDPFYLLTIDIHKPVSSNTIEKILELTQVDERIKILFNIKVKDNLDALECLDVFSKYYRILPNESFFTNVIFYFDDQDDEFVNELTKSLSYYRKKDIFIIPTFRKEITSSEYVNRVLNLIKTYYDDNRITSPEIIIDTQIRKLYGCNVQWDEIPIIFKDNKIYSTYCSNTCCMSLNPDYTDFEHEQVLISNMDDLRNISYIALSSNFDLPGFISCPLQNTSNDYMLINAYIHKLKEILYERYKN